jgi:hypothetical protein
MKAGDLIKIQKVSYEKGKLDERKRVLELIEKNRMALKKYRLQEGQKMAIIKYNWGIAMLENIEKEIKELKEKKE